MSKRQAAQIKRIIAAASERLYEKYKFGCEEHAAEGFGGELEDVPIEVVIEEAINEALDQVVYLYDIKEKLARASKGVQREATVRSA